MIILEAKDEGEEVKAQGQYPEERHHRHISTHLIRDRQKNNRATGGEGEPKELVRKPYRLPGRPPRRVDQAVLSFRTLRGFA
jgi:hypothetical protein